MHSPLSRLALLALIALPPGAGATETVYQAVTPPPANPAIVARPKDDWFQTVQEKFDRSSGHHADIVFDGDSITNRWETTGKDTWTARFAGRAADFGIEGDRTENVLWRLDKGQVDGVDPKLVVLMIGTNNISQNRETPEQIAAGVSAIVAEYEKRCPNAHIALMAVFPRGKTPDDGNRLKVIALNKLIAPLADGDRVSFIDIGPKLLEADGTMTTETSPDLLHPAARGYIAWADAIQPLVDRYVPKPQP